MKVGESTYLTPERVSATRATPAGSGRPRELPQGSTCAHCGAEIPDDAVVLKVNAGPDGGMFYILDVCVTALLAEARGVDDPMFERYRQRLLVDEHTPG